MDRRNFIKTSMCLGCGTALLSAYHSPLLPQISDKFSSDNFIYKRKEDLPKSVRLEACSLCQLKCPVCWIRDLETNVDDFFGYLKFSDFKNFVDDNPQIKNIELANSGEIFLNPELDKIIKYAYKKNIILTACNGVNLNDLSNNMPELLVKYKFNRLLISIDGATSETYKIYRVGGDFNKVISNIEKINYYKKKYNSEYPKMVYKFIVFGHNEHEIELAKHKAKELDMNICFQRNIISRYSPVQNTKKVTAQTGLSFEDNPYLNIIKDLDDIACRQLFKNPQISWNGDFFGCCPVRYKGFNVNVFEKGLLNALNSKIVLDAKHTLMDSSYVPKTNNPCLECWLNNEIIKKANINVADFI